MSLNRILYNCLLNLKLSDEYFMQFLIIMLGNVKTFVEFDQGVRLVFNNFELNLSIKPTWNNVVYNYSSTLDFRIDKEEYQRVINYVRNKNFL